MAKVTTKEQLILAISPFCGWNPDDPLNKYEEGNPDSFKPFCDIKYEEIKRVFTEFFEDHPFGKDMVNASEYTAVKEVVDHMPNINMMLWADEKVTDETLIDLIKQGLTPIERYRYPGETGKEFLDMCESTKKKVWENYEAGVTAIDLTKVSLDLPPKGKRAAIDKLLESASLPGIADLLTLSKGSATQLQAAQESEEKAKAKADTLMSDLERLKSELRNRMSEFSNIDVTYEEDGEVPEGHLTTKKASDIWPGIKGLDFDVPFFEWEGKHPQVPEIDENYIFREDYLKRALYAFVTNQRAYLQGHTGTGKTTLLEQIAAHLNFPFIRINFDSEITRMDLIGRDTLVDGKSEFIDGMLPRAMSTPCICTFDEIDFVRPDVAYVMQAALEGNGLRITEDGDRLVKPHPMFRMFGTGNTVGQGDEEGMYQGARPQSMAFLDRFTVWINVDYMEPEERLALIKSSYPTLTTEQETQIGEYVSEHMEAFTSATVGKPISPRGMLAIAKATTFFGDVRTAVQMTVLDACTGSDKATLGEIVDRVVK